MSVALGQVAVVNLVVIAWADKTKQNKKLVNSISSLEENYRGGRR